MLKELAETDAHVAANPVAALTGLRSAQLMQEPHLEQMMKGLAREAVAVAQASGHAFDADETIAYIKELLTAAGSATASTRKTWWPAFRQR